MNRTKKALSWILAASLLLGCLPPAASAAQAAVSAESSTVPAISLPESGELYEGYLERLFYSGSAVSFLGEAARERLGTLGRALYDFLNTNLQAVSSGASSSTVFHLSAEQILAWGGTVNYENAGQQTGQEAAAAALSSFKEEFEVENVISALLHDCPYSLYWYDKVTGVTESGKFTPSGSILGIDFKFAVVADMRGGNYSAAEPTFDTANAAAATAAAANAQALVEEFADCADHVKLLAYKDAVCSLVSYDRAAASGGDFSTDADPWQLIYVFDGDSTTNVVCEGYAKAFQYLYDLSEFQGSVHCITVLGTMSGQGHMWNIVTINAQNYLADITNSDADTPGADGALFLAGAAGDISSGYTAGGLTYVYDSDTLALWGTDGGSKLNIAAESYLFCRLGHTQVTDPALDATCTEAGLSQGTHCSACGQILARQQSIPAAGHDWQAAGCTAPKTCRACGVQEGSMLPHSYTDDWDASCEACGHVRELEIPVSPMYRLYNPYTQEHLLTADAAERDLLIGAGWSLDGVAWNAPGKGSPVYRLYNPYDDWHTYSMNREEIDMLVALGWQVDGVVCLSAAQEAGKPVYRLFNPYEQKNYHLLTSSEEERAMLEALGWRLDGAAWYCMAD